MNELTIKTPNEIQASQPQQIMTARKESSSQSVELSAYDTVRFSGGSSLKLTDKEQDILTAPLSSDEIQEDKSRGLLYAGHAVIRARLNKAIGIGAWCLSPVMPPMVQNNLVLSTWDLYVRGHFVSRVTGEQKYIPSNSQMTYGDAVEGSKSNALTRASKDMGIGLELWNPKNVAAIKKQGVQSMPQKSLSARIAPIQDDENPFDKVSDDVQSAGEDLSFDSASIPNSQEYNPPQLMENQARFTPSKVFEKTGESAKGKWKCFSVKVPDGRWLSTFSDTEGGIMHEACSGKREILVTWKEGAKGLTVLDIQIF